MSNSNEKYIGESLIREEPGKKLKLKIGDKVIKKKHLSDEVSEVFNDIDNLQNEIDSLEVAGIALSNDYGSNPLIGISQMKLTESYNEQTEKNAQYDETLGEHTTELENTYRKSETYSKEQLDEMITTPDQQYVTVTATVGTTSITDVLPATGEADTIYRVGNWDGTQYDEGGYTEYAWDGTQYIKLSVKEPGIDDEPVAGSNNLVKSGGVLNSEFKMSEFSQSLIKIGEYSLNKDSFGLEQGYYYYDGEQMRHDTTDAHNCIKLDIRGYSIDEIGLTNAFSNPRIYNVAYETLTGIIKSYAVPLNSRVRITDDVAILYLNFFSTEDYPDTTFTFYSDFTINASKSGLPLLSKMQIESQRGIDNNALYKELGVPFLLNGYIDASIGEFHSTVLYKSTDFIPVVEGDIVKYKVYNAVSPSLANTTPTIAAYDSQKAFLSESSIIPSESGIVESEYIVPSGVCYIRLCCRYNINQDDIQIYNTCYCIINSIMSIKEKFNELVNGGIDDIVENYLDTTKIKGNQIIKEYYNEDSNVELVDSELNDQYYSQSGTSIEVKNMSGLGSLFAINVVEGRKYHLKLMQEVGPLTYKSYFIFAIDNTTAAIQDTEISQYVKSIDAQNYIWEITIPQGCKKVITAGYKSTFESFWIKELAQESLEWLLVNEDNLSEELKEKINGPGEEQEEIVALQTQMNKVDNTLHLFDSIKKPITFNGKTLVAFGDSITYGVSSPNLQPAGENKYISLFCNYVGCTLNNQANSGACITNGMNQITSIHDKILAFTGNADIIWIAGGVNDWQAQASIGTYNDTDNTTLYGALKEICSFLKTNYSDAVVIFVTPIPTTSTTTFGTQHPDNLNLYRKAIQEIAAVNGFNIINGADLGLPDEMTSYGNAMFDNSDRVHPTIVGHALYARSLTGKLL